MEGHAVSRRTFLKGSSLGVASALLAGCVQAVGTPGPGVSETPAGPSAPLKLTIAPWYAPAVIPQDGNMIQQAVEKEFDVDLEFWWFERSTATDQLMARVAGGAIPDMYALENPAARNELYDQEVAAEVPIATIAEHAPRIFQAANTYTTLSWLGGYYKGKNWGKPNMWPHQVKPLCNAWRKDSLDQVGYSTPPETIDQFEDAMTKMVEQGLHSYGLVNRYGDWPWGCFNTFYLAYGASRNQWMERADKSGVDHGMTLDGAREAVATLQRWYEKGLIHPESVTTNFEGLTNLWCNGVAGYGDAMGVWYLPKGGYFDCIEGGEIARAYAPKGPDGKFGYVGFGYAVTPINFGNTVIAQPEKLARLLEMHDLLDSDPEWAIFIAHGNEGEHWFRDDVGLITRNADIDDNEAAEIGLQMFQTFYPNADLYATVYGRSDYAEVVEPAEAGNVDNILTELGPFIDPEAAKQASELQAIQYKWEWDFISGVKPLDQWPDYIQEWNDNGGRVWSEAANTAYQNYAAELATLQAAIDAAGG